MKAHAWDRASGSRAPTDGPCRVCAIEVVSRSVCGIPEWDGC